MSSSPRHLLFPLLPTSLVPRRLPTSAFSLLGPPRVLRRPRRPARRLGLIPHLLPRTVPLLPLTRSAPQLIPTLNPPAPRGRWERALALLLGSCGAVKERARIKVFHDGDGRELFLVRIRILVRLGRVRVTFCIDAGPLLPVRVRVPFHGCVFATTVSFPWTDGRMDWRYRNGTHAVRRHRTPLRLSPRSGQPVLRVYAVAGW